MFGIRAVQIISAVPFSPRFPSAFSLKKLMKFSTITALFSLVAAIPSFYNDHALQQYEQSLEQDYYNERAPNAQAIRKSLGSVSKMAGGL
jgi:hypothetical protein